MFLFNSYMLNYQRWFRLWTVILNPLVVESRGRVPSRFGLLCVNKWQSLSLDPHEDHREIAIKHNWTHWSISAGSKRFTSGKWGSPWISSTWISIGVINHVSIGTKFFHQHFVTPKKTYWHFTFHYISPTQSTLALCLFITLSNNCRICYLLYLLIMLPITIPFTSVLIFFTIITA